MTAILLSACTIYESAVGEYKKILVVTPATADSNDTIDITALVNDGKLAGIPSRWDVTTGDEITATYNTTNGVVTIDAAGGTTDHVYALEFLVLGKDQPRGF